jgi:hypothetical protein
MKIKDFKEEHGFFSAILLIFLVTLALMGAGAFVLMKTEGEAVANNATGLRLEYAANGGIFYAIRLLEADSLDQVTSFTLDGITVSLDTTREGSTTYLNVNAGSGDFDRDIDIEMREGRYCDKAIVTTGDVGDLIFTKDAAGNFDSGLLLEKVTRMPSIDIVSLKALSSSQGHDKGTFTPANNSPVANFYYSAGVPNVTYTTGNMTVNSSRTIYGIYLVEGTVTLNSNAVIQGVVYLLNNNAITIAGGASLSDRSINGGLISKGDVIAGGLFCYVRHNPAYMNIFQNYVTNPNSRVVKVVNWDYQ